MKRVNKIALLDCGSQFAHLLANRIRRLGVYCEILDAETPAKDLKNYVGLILSGGPTSVNASDAPNIDPEIFELKIPVLAVCYGHQFTIQTLGGRVATGKVGEYGLTQFTVQRAEGHLEKLEPRTYEVYASHFDTVAELPEGFEVVGTTPDDPFSATMNRERKIYTLQFHPEVTHTEGGMDILDAFVDITGAARDWSIETFIKEEIEKIHEQVGDKKVFMLISGGVDSSVAYMLLAKALGPERIYAMLVDTGFMRKNEVEHVKHFLSEAGVKNLHVYDGAEDYFADLREIYDPEEKRKIIGDKFLEIQRKVAQELQLNSEEWLLGQGTIYPDTIESGGTKNADKIKTHHNRVPEIEEMIKAGKIIEPLKELYKDEVRMVGRQLGLSAEMVDRHPFPGPGLAVRCLCLEEASPIMLDIEAGDYKATPLPVKSVGVQGDERTYRHPIALEGDRSWDHLRGMAPKLTNTYRDINRVIFTLALKHGSLIEDLHATPGYLTPERIATLQEADALVMEALKVMDPEGLVWQCPTVLLPLSVNSEGEESIVLRPISSTEAMTANFTELPWEAIQVLAQRILQIPGISAVFYDITNKPPGTIEWE